MKKLISIIIFSPVLAFAKVDVTVDELWNVAGSTILEVCGQAKSDIANSRVQVIVRHSDASYSTLADRKTNKWCVLVARRTFDGKVQVEANDDSGQSTEINVDFSQTNLSDYKDIK